MSEEINNLEDFSAALYKLDLRDGDVLVLYTTTEITVEKENQWFQWLSERLKQYRDCRVGVILLPQSDRVTIVRDNAVKALLAENDRLRQELLQYKSGFKTPEVTDNERE